MIKIDEYKENLRFSIRIDGNIKQSIQYSFKIDIGSNISIDIDNVENTGQYLIVPIINIYNVISNIGLIDKELNSSLCILYGDRLVIPWKGTILFICSKPTIQVSIEEDEDLSIIPSNRNNDFNVSVYEDEEYMIESAHNKNNILTEETKPQKNKQNNRSDIVKTNSTYGNILNNILNKTSKK